jgi:hypothetical protein
MPPDIYFYQGAERTFEAFGWIIIIIAAIGLTWMFGDLVWRTRSLWIAAITDRLRNLFQRWY